LISIDKVGIIVTVVVVTIALGFLATVGTVISSNIPSAIERTTASIKETGQETTEKLKELTTSKLPSRLVSIPQGTSIPGCEGVNLCYNPPTLIIFSGGEVIWRNDDSSVHTVTSGDIINGPDMKFDSGLIKSEQTFSYMFEESGEYQYFCMIHPWANGSVTVK
jgi:plastocyanin